MQRYNDTSQKRALPSGRFNLRIEPELHASLRCAARSAGTSLNEYCARRLASPGPALSPAAGAVVKRAVGVLGDSLLGVVAFGSWARGEATSGSDLDVLMITADTVPIVRGLYRCWDDGPALSWAGHEVTPHFVRLPSRGAAVSGLWAEVAMDGLILVERELVVSRHLAGVRRRILRRELLLRVAGGARYWAHKP